MRPMLSVLLLSLFVINLCAMDKLHNQQQTTKVLTYNICTTFNLYGTSLDPANRLPKIIQQIRDDLKPDIACFQEARKKEAQYLSKHLHKLGYGTVLSPVNGGENSATLVTAYNDRKFFCQDNKRWWYTSGDPTKFGKNEWYEWGRILTLATLYKLKGDMPDYDQAPLHVANTHLGLKRDEKTMSIALALKLLKNHTNGQPTIWCGDFNFFDDEGGTEHRQMITSSGFDDLLESLTNFKGQPLSGTFVGYSTDKFIPKSLDKLTKLDGMFSQNIEATPARYPEVNLEYDLSNRDELPSDHLPILTEIY